jgi:hypothetical protein
VGPRAGLDAVSKRKIPSPRRDSNPYHPARSQSLYRLSYPGSYDTARQNKMNKKETTIKYTRLYKFKGKTKKKNENTTKEVMETETRNV